VEIRHTGSVFSMSQREKYSVLRKLDSGGMAEVFVGEAEGIEGFKKRVAIKRVLPHLAENTKFLTMFLDEARLSLRMNHANVVQVFDIGRSGGTYFIVMEYVDGTNLKRIMETVREKNGRLPVAHAVYIVMEVCKGLAYAHALTDHEGKSYGIVHRDVSPPNVLLSKQGEVKIVDFGLAKATSQLERTDPGVVKGKFAYLAPEAAWGRTVDHRADIFACGIILYELLTGRRLFLGETDVQTVELVRLGDVPSVAKQNPDVPAELEGILRKSLAKDPADRFQSCNDLGEMLAGFLFSQRLKVTGFDLQRMVKAIVAADDAREVQKPSIIDKLISDELQKFSTLEDDVRDSVHDLDAGDQGGQRALDPSGFEDPRAWLGELGSVEEDGPLSSDGGWREPGLESDDGLEDRLAPPEERSPAAHEGASLAQMLEGEVRLGSEVREEEEGNGKWLLMGVGVAAFLALAMIVAVLAYAAGVVP
jgi:eukaryotic-like serine/threonine-protein kinase